MDGKDDTHDHGTDVIVEANARLGNRASSEYKETPVIPQTQLIKDIDNSLEPRGATCNEQRTKDVGKEGCVDVSEPSEETELTLQQCHDEPEPSKETVLPSINCHDAQAFSRESLLTSNNDDKITITPYERHDATSVAQEGLSIQLIKDWTKPIIKQVKDLFGKRKSIECCPNHFLLMFATASGKLVFLVYCLGFTSF